MLRRRTKPKRIYDGLLPLAGGIYRDCEVIKRVYHPRVRAPSRATTTTLSRPVTASLSFCSLLFPLATVLAWAFALELRPPTATVLPAPSEAAIAPRDLPLPISTAEPNSSRDQPDSHYLLLVNTAIAKQLDAEKMAQFDRSPYDGLAVSCSRMRL